ncbi:MAG: zinc-binding dehydrogenase [Clostridiaceae bacterium]|nr:zinc-binding dehydrogenase [Clostridiaceae bacterium]
MKAYAALSPGAVEAIELPIPEPDDYEVLVKNEGCVFCNTTDRMIVDDLFATPAYPVVFGHESFGKVVKVGSRVRQFKLGDRVICSNAIVRGFDGTYYSSWGGFAECGIAGDLDAYLADGHLLDTANAYRGRYAANLVIPGDLPIKKAALAFPLAETASAAMQVGDLRGKHIVVIGTGIAGYSLTYFAHAYGAASVTALGRRESRLGVSKQLGADYTFVRPSDISSLLAPFGGADVVFEASGNYAVLENGLPYLREGGTLAVYAVPHRPYTFDLLKSPQSFLYQRISPRVRDALDLVCGHLREDKLPVDALLTHVWDFDELPRAFDQVRVGEVVKGLVLIGL